MSCIAQVSCPPPFPKLPSIVTYHGVLNTTFAQFFLNIFKEIQEFKSNEMVTPPSATFASL